MNPSASQGQSAARMWSLVPRWTRAMDSEGSGLIKTLIEALGVSMDAARDDVLRLLDDMFVETCDPSLIPLIGDLVGAEVDRRIPIPRQRDQVNAALHLLRRRGTIEQIERLGWQTTGFRVRVHEAPSMQRTVKDPPLAARLIGLPRARVHSEAVRVSYRVPRGRLEIVMDVAWPVRKRTIELEQLSSNIYAVDATRPVGLRRPDGTPIFLSDDPFELVGPGKAIEVNPISPEEDLLYPPIPRFMRLTDDVPVSVPHRTLAIDPEWGRVAWPSGPTPKYRRPGRPMLRFWEPLCGECLSGAPASQGDGVFTFSPDGRTGGLTDEQGIRLRLAFNDERRNPTPTPEERLLVVCHRLPPRPRMTPRSRADRFRAEDSDPLANPAYPFVVLPPGVPFDPKRPAAEQGLILDVPGLNRFFSIQDPWGWDLFPSIRLVSRFGVESPPDGAVEVDIDRGRFRVGPSHEGDIITVSYYQRYEITAIRERGERALEGALPLGCTATFHYRDTAPGNDRSTKP